MRYRYLGGSNILVSAIGFGSWGIGGLTEGATSYGATDDAESKAALNAAFHEGITLYDTSDLYGYGRSEGLIGEVLRKRRHRIVIATKGGLTKHGGPHDLSPAYLRRCLEGSLRRLRTDYVDIYQLHSPPVAMVVPEVMETLYAFRAEGKIREFGFSVKSPDDGLAAIHLGFPVIQVNFSMLDQRALMNGLFKTARAKSIGIIGRTPLNFGFLSNAHQTSFPSDDHRSQWPKEQRERWAAAATLFASLNKGKKRTMVQLALRFCLDFRTISGVIPGILHPQEAMENAAVSELDPLTEEEQRQIEAIRAAHEFFVPAGKEQS